MGDLGDRVPKVEELTAEIRTLKNEILSAEEELRKLTTNLDEQNLKLKQLDASSTRMNVVLDSVATTMYTRPINEGGNPYSSSAQLAVTYTRRCIYCGCFLESVDRFCNRYGRRASESQRRVKSEVPLVDVLSRAFKAKRKPCRAAGGDWKRADLYQAWRFRHDSGGVAQLLRAGGLRFPSKSAIARMAAALFLISLTVVLGSQPGLVRADLSPYGGNTTIVPTKNALLFGSSGNVKIDIPVPGIAVRIEVPREFLQGVVSKENDTHWITSNIRNDYYYYNVVDESLHWTYDWQDNASDGPCFKPNFSYYDRNAPYCVEIWNYLSTPYNKTSPILQQPDHTILCYVPGTFYDSSPACPPNYFTNPAHTLDYTYLTGVDYCQAPHLDKYVFGCFTAPRFVMFHNLVSPTVAGLYNFTLFVANRTNILGYPDFVHAWNTTLFVPVSMAYNAGSISGQICDGGSPTCTPIRGKGIVYAANAATGAIVARAYVNQSLCMHPSLSGCGLFKLTGLAPGTSEYLVEGSAGVDNGYAYSLTQYPCCATVSANVNNPLSGQLALNRAPLFCGLIEYENTTGGPYVPSLTGQSYLLKAGFRANPAFELNITVEATDPAGHVIRFRGISSNSSSGDSFSIITGTGVKYVGTDPYGTEFAGLPAFDELPGYPQGYQLTPKVYVSGYYQYTFLPASVSGPTDSGSPPSCSNPVGTSGNITVTMRAGGVISGTLQFCNSLPLQACQPQSPYNATSSLSIPALFGGNIVVEAFSNLGVLSGMTVINGNSTLPNGKTGYESCGFSYACASLPFYVTGFSEYYNHSLSGIWGENDYGLPDGTYSLQVYVRGYELTSTNPASITISGASNQTVSAYMSRGGAFEVTVGSYDSRLGLVINGTRAIQAQLPWRFLNSSIPVTARVYFYASSGVSLGYVEALMQLRVGVPNEIGVISFTNFTFKVIFAGQNWSLRDIWFYGDVPTYITNDTYTVLAYTLGYVRQFPSGITSSNQLLGFNQALIALFAGNELDITVPIFSTPQTFTKTPEYDHAIGQVFSGSSLMGAEMTNLTASIPNLQFNVFGFGAMQLTNSTSPTNATSLCITNVLLVGPLNICGQGHFYYVPPNGGCIEAQDAGTCIFDYGLDALTYTAALPEFGFTVHFLQVLALPVVSFNDLLLQQGVFLQAIQMALIYQGPISVVAGYCNSPPASGFCYVTRPSNLAPLSWAQVQASNSTYSRVAPTFDGLYDGVGALFVPAGTYTITFSDVQYQSQTMTNQIVQWGGSYALTPPTLTPLPP